MFIGCAFHVCLAGRPKQSLIPRMPSTSNMESTTDSSQMSGSAPTVVACSASARSHSRQRSAARETSQSTCTSYTTVLGAAKGQSSGQYELQLQLQNSNRQLNSANSTVAAPPKLQSSCPSMAASFSAGPGQAGGGRCSAIESSDASQSPEQSTPTRETQPLVNGFIERDESASDEFDVDRPLPSMRTRATTSPSKALYNKSYLSPVKALIHSPGEVEKLLEFPSRSNSDSHSAVSNFSSCFLGTSQNSNSLTSQASEPRSTCTGLLSTATILDSVLEPNQNSKTFIAIPAPPAPPAIAQSDCSHAPNNLGRTSFTPDAAVAAAAAAAAHNSPNHVRTRFDSLDSRNSPQSPAEHTRPPPAGHGLRSNVSTDRENIPSLAACGPALPVPSAVYSGPTGPTSAHPSCTSQPHPVDESGGGHMLAPPNAPTNLPTFPQLDSGAAHPASQPQPDRPKSHDLAGCEAASSVGHCCAPPVACPAPGGAAEHSECSLSRLQNSVATKCANELEQHSGEAVTQQREAGRGVPSNWGPWVQGSSPTEPAQGASLHLTLLNGHVQC